MIHKQQTGHCSENIIAACAKRSSEITSTLAKGKTIEGPVIFQGGVAANVGIVAAFERILNTKIIIPQHYDVMGAYGAAILAQEEVEETGKETSFRGFDRFTDDLKSGASNVKAARICARSSP
jgi:activator of 2-hydroxyglutaryl-CoA dehydratase